MVTAARVAAFRKGHDGLARWSSRSRVWVRTQGWRRCFAPRAWDGRRCRATPPTWSLGKTGQLHRRSICMGAAPSQGHTSVRFRLRRYCKTFPYWDSCGVLWPQTRPHPLCCSDRLSQVSGASSPNEGTIYSSPSKVNTMDDGLEMVRSLPNSSPGISRAFLS